MGMKLNQDIEQFNMYYYRSEIIKDYWEIPLFICKRGLSSSLILVEPLSKKMQTIPNFLLEDYVNEDDSDYKKVFIPKENEEYTISEYETRLLTRFHYSWFNILREYLLSDKFKNTIAATIKERKTSEVFPEPTQIFSAFLTDYHSIKCLWLGLSPYFTKQEGRLDANGFCFSTYNKKKTASLEVLQAGIRKDMQYGFNWVLRNDLFHLNQQGVMLLNSALTTTCDANSHILLWKEFIQFVIDKLDVPVIAFGKVAQSFQFKNKVWNVYHPAYYARSKSEPDYTCFSELNNILNIEY
jgi:uracil DNA glycosylase